MTNGFNLSKVLTALEGRISWRLPLSGSLSEENVISTELVTSASGRYFDDFHPLVTLNNLFDIQPYSDITNEQFNQYVTDLNKSALIAVLNSIFDSSQIVEQGMTFEYEEDVLPTYLHGQKFVGCKIEIAEGYAMKVNQLVLFFNGVKTFNIYLYHSRTKNPIKTKSVTTAANEQTIVDVTDWEINPYDYKGGYFYIGYFQTDLGDVMAIDNEDEVEDFKAVGVEPVEIDVVDSSPNFGRQVETCYSYGVIHDISVYRDYTRRITSMPHIFDNAIGLYMAANIIEMFIYTLRSNGTERAANNDDLNRLYVALNTAEDQTVVPYIAGLKQKLQKAIKDIKGTMKNNGRTFVVTPE